jgi:integrase/recombinase XerD
VLDVCGVNGSGDVGERRYSVRRVWLPTLARESFTVIGPDRRPVQVVDEYLAWLTDCERSPNTVEAYAHDLRVFFTFLDEHGLRWDQVGVMELAEFAAWARRPARNVVVLADEASRLSPRTVNRMLIGVVGFYELQARHGNTLADQLVVRTRSGRGGYKPFLHGIARSRPRGRAVRLPEQRLLPRTLSLEQVAAVIDAQERLRDRFLFALLASTGMRIGQALGLRHEDVIAWDRLIAIHARQEKVGFTFTPHQFRHTYATLAYREGVTLEVIGALLTHRSPSSALVYTHPTAEDLRNALAKRGVLERVADLVV